MNMRVLMIGWEFPPVVTGGLGVACAGIVRGLKEYGVDTLFMLPRKQDAVAMCDFIFADIPEGAYGSGVYLPSGFYMDGDWYDAYLDEVYQYARRVRDLAAHEQFDVIHAHDWRSYLAGIAAREATGKPLVVHVHATAKDQSGGQGYDPAIHAIERKAFHEADAVVTVSNYTRRMVVQEHDVNPDKIKVVYNGADLDPYTPLPQSLDHLKSQGKKIVLYHGRITIQKGADYFVRAAKKVLEFEPNTVFIISGSGDMEGQVIRLATELGIADNVIFTGATWGEDRDRLYQAADLFVMPSVSEPFGIVPLESLINGTPVLISKQSGVSEVLQHALKVDFWDVDEMSNQIIAALRYKPLAQQLVQYGQGETKKVTWRKAAEQCRNIYNRFATV